MRCRCCSCRHARPTGNHTSISAAWRDADKVFRVRIGRCFSFGIATLLLTLAGCSAGAVQRDAVCDRSNAIDIAVGRTGELAKGVKSVNPAALRNQMDEDLNNLVAALDVAPKRISGDLATVSDRLRDLYGALELLDWDPVRFVSDQTLALAVANLGSVNTTRHLARITDYLLTSCQDEASAALPPPDSVVQLPPTSTSIATNIEEPIPADQDLLTAHVAMGSAIAESLGLKVTVDEAECLGREADLVSLSVDQAADGNYDDLFRPIFAKCGVNVTDQPAP